MTTELEPRQSGGAQHLGAPSDRSKDAATIELTITFRKDVHELHDLPEDTTLGDLRGVIEQLTAVEGKNQKLLPTRAKGIANLNQLPRAPEGGENGSAALENDQRTLAEVGIPAQGLRIMVVGTPSKELETVQAEEDYARRRNGPRQYHPSMLRGTKPRNTTAPGASFSPFASIQPHASTPPSSPLHAKITEFLTRLANDAGILHICKLYDLRVGVLTELLPWEHPELLGLNENAGQRVSLRLRTDDAEGLRNYATTRRVLVHELAHNRYGGHANDFKTFNSELNAQIAGLEKRQAEGTHSFLDGDVFEPTAASGEAGTDGGRRLGSSTSGTAAEPGSVEERRQRILSATMKRLEKEEQEIEESCGSAR